MPFGHHRRNRIDDLLSIETIVRPVLVLDAELGQQTPASVPIRCLSHASLQDPASGSKRPTNARLSWRPERPLCGNQRGHNTLYLNTLCCTVNKLAGPPRLQKRATKGTQTSSRSALRRSVDERGASLPHSQWCTHNRV